MNIWVHNRLIYHANKSNISRHHLQISRLLIPKGSFCSQYNPSFWHQRHKHARLLPADAFFTVKFKAGNNNDQQKSKLMTQLHVKLLVI